MDADLEWRWELERTATYIRSNGFKRVTLQFPDGLLRDAPLVAGALQQRVQDLGSKVYLLADTTYNPLGVDEVAAQHVNADCVVHYGYASLYPVSRLPALCILPKQQLDVPAAAAWIAQQLQEAAPKLGVDQSTPGSGTVLVLTDQAYQHLLPELQQALQLAYQGPPLRLVWAQPAATELWPQAAAASSSTAAGTSPHEHHQQQQQQQQGQQALDPPEQMQEAGSSPPKAHAAAVAAATPPPVGGLVLFFASPNNSSSSSSSSSNGVSDHTQDADSTSSSRPQQQQQQQQQQEQVPNGALLLWVGPLGDSPPLTELQLTHSSSPWLLMDPATRQVQQGLSPELQRLLKRRYFLVEKAKGAQLVGLLVGTLGAAGYLQVLQRLQQLVKQADKRSYTLLMGKPNPAKLANFPEIEVFVMVADPQGLLLDSKDYLAPIITPYEAWLAFTGQSLQLPTYRLDPAPLFASSSDSQGAGGVQKGAGAACSSTSSGMAAFGGNIIEDEEEEEDEQVVTGLTVGVSSMSLAVKGGSSMAAPGQQGGQLVAAKTAAEYLTKQRTWQGVDTPATGAELKQAGPAVAGRSGRAAGYVDEPQSAGPSG